MCFEERKGSSNVLFRVAMVAWFLADVNDCKIFAENMHVDKAEFEVANCGSCRTSWTRKYCDRRKGQHRISCLQDFGQFRKQLQGNIAIVDQITEWIRADSLVIDMPLFDTRKREGKNVGRGDRPVVFVLCCGKGKTKNNIAGVGYSQG